MSQRTAWLRRAGAVVLGFGVALAAAEAIVRVFVPNARDRTIPGHLIVIDDVLGWKLRPSRTTRHRTRYFDVEYTVDAHGFRDGRSLDESAGGPYRIALYGDSVVFGWGVRDGDRFSNLVERDAGGVLIVNRGVPGYGLDQEVLLHEREPMRADEAMFFVTRSILVRLRSGFIYSKYKPMFVMEPLRRLTLVPVPARRNAAVSLLYETLSPFYLPYVVEAWRQEWAASRTNPAANREAYTLGDGVAEAILDRAQQNAGRKRERMSILAASLSARDRQELRRFSAERGIAFREIPPGILATPAGEDLPDLIHGRFDRHLNARGHAVTAKQLAPQLTH